MSEPVSLENLFNKMTERKDGFVKQQGRFFFLSFLVKKIYNKANTKSGVGDTGSMKKIVVLLAVVCGISGCKLKGLSDSQTGIGHDSVIVRQGGESINLYELIVFKKGYDKKTNTWVAGDGAHLSDVLAEVAEDLPSAALKNDFEVQIPENFRFYYMDVFDETYEKILRKYPDSDESGEGLAASEKCMNYLEELSCGTYYISIAVVEEGNYIESEGQRETTGYEYAFRLDKDMPPKQK